MWLRSVARRCSTSTRCAAPRIGWLVAHAATSELEKQTASQLLQLSIAVAPERFDVLYLLAIPLLVSRLRLYGAATRAAVIAHLVRALAVGPIVTRADASSEWLASATGALWAFGNALALGDDVDVHAADAVASPTTLRRSRQSLCSWPTWIQ
jgi:hypothetical protein